MNRSTKPDPWNILLLAGSILALLISFVGAAGTFLLGVVGVFIGGTATGNSAWVLVGTFVGLAFISLPSSWAAFQALQGNTPAIQKPSPRLIQWLLITFPFILVLGTLAFQGNVLPSLIGPAAHFFAALVPVLVLVALILRQAPQISQRRGWAHFMAGLWISPIGSLLIEVLAAIPIVLLVISEINTTLGQDFIPGILENPGAFPDPNTFQSLTDVLSKPLYLFLIIAYLGIFVPIIEELIKAVGILPLLSRKVNEAEGFLGGVLAGAGYGLFEALYLGQPGPGWAALMLARGGATLMHMFTAGLTGTGIARAKNDRSFLAFLRKYALAVGLHALWNLAAVVMGIGFAREALPSANITPAAGYALAIGGGLILVILSVLAFRGLLRSSQDPQGKPAYADSATSTENPSTS